MMEVLLGTSFMGLEACAAAVSQKFPDPAVRPHVNKACKMMRSLGIAHNMERHFTEMGSRAWMAKLKELSMCIVKGEVQPASATGLELDAAPFTPRWPHQELEAKVQKIEEQLSAFSAGLDGLVRKMDLHVAENAHQLRRKDTDEGFGIEPGLEEEPRAPPPPGHCPVEPGAVPVPRAAAPPARPPADQCCAALEPCTPPPPEGKPKRMAVAKKKTAVKDTVMDVSACTDAGSKQGVARQRRSVGSAAARDLAAAKKRLEQARCVEAMLGREWDAATARVAERRARLQQAQAELQLVGCCLDELP